MAWENQEERDTLPSKKKNKEAKIGNGKGEQKNIILIICLVIPIVPLPLAASWPVPRAPSYEIGWGDSPRGAASELHRRWDLWPSHHRPRTVPRSPPEGPGWSIPSSAAWARWAHHPNGAGGARPRCWRSWGGGSTPDWDRTAVWVMANRRLGRYTGSADASSWVERRCTVFRAAPTLVAGLAPDQKSPAALASALERLRFGDLLGVVVVDGDDSSRRRWSPPRWPLAQWRRPPRCRRSRLRSKHDDRQRRSQWWWRARSRWSLVIATRSG